jgi:23S rRNA (uridine2552-2'-O)-methyltransferase
MVIGIDLNPIEGLLPENVKTIQDDVTSVTPTAIRSVVGFDRDIVFDVIISDMAPNTTGSRTVDHHQSVRLCHTAIDLTATMLLPKGNLVMKVLEGEAYRDLLDRAAQCFDIAKGFKPKASRSISTEIFIVCTGRKSEMPESTPCAPPTPTTGW